MKIGFLITARLKSSRLHLKLLLPLNGYTVIERVIQRAKSVIECDDIVLCTSSLNQDLPLVRIAKENNIYYFNGHSDDVLQRLLDASILFNLDYFIGITADNPLFSIYHANLLVDIVKRNPSIDFAYTSGMPIGINIYAMKVKALETVCAVKEEVDTEIWGYLIKRPEIFNIQEIKAENIFSRNYRMTLDERSDYLFLKAIYDSFSKEEVICLLSAYDYLDKNQEFAKINVHVLQRDLDQNTKDKIDKFYLSNKNTIISVKNRIYSK